MPEQHCTLTELQLILWKTTITFQFTPFLAQPEAAGRLPSLVGWVWCSEHYAMLAPLGGVASDADRCFLELDSPQTTLEPEGKELKVVQCP